MLNVCLNSLSFCPPTERFAGYSNQPGVRLFTHIHILMRSNARPTTLASLFFALDKLELFHNREFKAKIL